jgi:acetyl-CoA synthetase
VLRDLGVRKGDRVSRLVITADEAWRGGKTIALKRNVDAAIALRADSPVDKVVLVRRTGAEVAVVAGRDVSYEDLMATASSECPMQEMGAEDPLFILYNSGSTGKPKGVLHTTSGYLVFASYTFENVFDYRDQDVYWCTVDVGWVTEHSYVIYGPLSNGATTLMFEGTPKYPDPGRFWQVCDTHRVTILYTSPTAIRSLVAEGDHWVQQHGRKSLRLLGSVGEPINQHRDRTLGRAAQRARADWGVCGARCDPVGARPAKNPQRQDHAAHPAQDRRQ